MAGRPRDQWPDWLVVLTIVLVSLVASVALVAVCRELGQALGWRT